MKCVMCGSTAACDGCPISTGFFLAERLTLLEAGERRTIARLATRGSGDLRKLLALGLLPGTEVEVERRRPALVLRVGTARIALDSALAEAVIVSREV
ncbi:MAG: ferrous iron transport protein A [Gemmatimonadetes bacterium]|nr:ferrous iron transport protein A [Gemmatimonadota bacterium]